MLWLLHREVEAPVRVKSVEEILGRKPHLPEGMCRCGHVSRRGVRRTTAPAWWSRVLSAYTENA